MVTEQEYIDSLLDQYGTLQSYEPSLREKAVGALVNLGMPMNTAQGFMGNLYLLSLMKQKEDLQKQKNQPII